MARGVWPAGELALWRWRAGILDEAPARMAAPFALHIAGRFNEAAAAWRALGCPYEEAAALADTGDEPTLAPDTARRPEAAEPLGVS